MVIDKREAQKKFEQFLLIMDDQLDSLAAQARERGIALDFSLGTLDKLEELFDLLSKDLTKEDLRGLAVFFGRHLGEIARTNIKGQWILSLENEKDANFNMPIVVHTPPVEGLEFVPIRVMRAYALRRKRGILKRAVNAFINPQPIDLSHLIEEEP